MPIYSYYINLIKYSLIHFYAYIYIYLLYIYICLYNTKQLVVVGSSPSCIGADFPVFTRPRATVATTLLALIALGVTWFGEVERLNMSYTLED